MPGCESLEKIGPDEYRMKMKVLLAALSGEFEGKMRIADQAPPTSFRLIVEGSGRIGFLKGDGLLKLAPAATVRVLSAAPSEPPETIVSYEGDAQVGGTMAAVGQRLIDGTSKSQCCLNHAPLISNSSYSVARRRQSTGCGSAAPAVRRSRGRPRSRRPSATSC